MFDEYSKLYPTSTGIMLMLAGILTLVAEYCFIRMFCNPMFAACICLIVVAVVSIVNKIILSIYAVRRYIKLPKTKEEIKSRYADEYAALKDIINMALIRKPVICNGLALFLLPVLPLFIIDHGFKVMTDDLFYGILERLDVDPLDIISSSTYYCPINVFSGTLGDTVKAVTDAFDVCINKEILYRLLITGEIDDLPKDLIYRRFS